MAGPRLWPWLAGSGGGQSPPVGMTNVANTNISIGGTANTKGSWVQISASLPWDVAGVIVNHQDTGGTTDGTMLYDIGVGSAGNEYAVIENIYNLNNRVSTSTRVPMLCGRFFPIALKAGQRLAARAQASVTTAKSPSISLSLIRGHPGMVGGKNRVIAIGANTSTSAGTVIGSSSSTTLSAWTQLTGSCPADVVAIMPYVFNPTTADPAASIRAFANIGIGASGSEHPLVERLITMSVTGMDMTGPTDPAPANWLPCFIPAGSRVVAQQKNQTSTTNTALQCIVYGLVA